MYQKIKAKFKANPTIFYACSIVASWAGVGSLMNFRTLAINNGAAAAIIWAVFNSLACIFFGLFAEYIPTVRRIMQSKVMFYFIGFLTVFQTWTQMSGIYEIFGDTPIGTTGGTLIVYGTCLVFLFMLLKEGMIRNVLLFMGGCLRSAGSRCHCRAGIHPRCIRQHRPRPDCCRYPDGPLQRLPAAARPVHLSVLLLAVLLQRQK